MRLRATLNPEGFLRFIRNLLAELAEETGKQGVSENSAVIRKARAYASRHCGEIHFSLQKTADHVGLSKNHFSRVFHDATGVRFWDYVTELRGCRLVPVLLAVASDERDAAGQRP